MPVTLLSLLMYEFTMRGIAQAATHGQCVQDCRGHAPNYEGAREVLRGTLHALRHLFHEALGPLLDSRTGRDLLPALLQGKALSRHCLDFSGAHSAVLWLGPSIAAAGVRPASAAHRNATEPSRPTHPCSRTRP